MFCFIIIGSRAFAVSGPICWNALPPTIPKVTVVETRTVLWFTEDNPHGAAVVTLQDLCVDKYCLLTLTLTLLHVRKNIITLICCCRDFLPRGSGIVTRRPLVLQLFNAKQGFPRSYVV